MPALDQKLAAVLASREDRGIRRRLPTASLTLLPSTPSITSDPTSDISSDISTTITATAASPSASASSAQPQPQPQHTPPNPSAAPSADFSSNDYLSLSTFPLLRTRVLAALTASPAIPGSGGSRLLVYNHAHAALEARLGKDVPRARSPPLQLGLRRQRGLLRVHTAAGRRAPLRLSHPRFRPRRRARLARRTAFPPPIRTQRCARAPGRMCGAQGGSE